MTTDELASIMSTRGFVSRTRREEVQVQACVFCGNSRWNLELSAVKGVYHCWACRASGRLDIFLREFTDVDVAIPVQEGGKRKRSAPLGTPAETWRAWDVPSARRYLNRRGLAEQECDRYELGVGVDKGHAYHGRLVIPLREFWTQRTVGHIARRYVGTNGPKYLAEVEPTITGYRVRDNDTAYVVVEGPFDGICVHRGGFNVALLLGLGEDEAVDEWAGRVAPEIPVVVLLDGSAKKRSRQIANRIEVVRGSSAAVNIAQLPEDLDPAQLDPSVIARLIGASIVQDG